jgi:TonB-dependent receptor
MDHPTDRPTKVQKKDRTGTWISFGLHAGVIVISLIILSQTELGRQLTDSILGATRDQKKQPDRPKPPPAPARTGQRRAPLDAPPPSGGPRRAADAPPPVGEGFFTEVTERKTSGSGSGEGAKTNVALKVVAPTVKVAPPKIFSSAQAKSDIKQLYAERAKEAAATEAFGSEQISKTGVSDAGAIIKNVSGATIVDGKFAVIRGLSDRYVTTTLNGTEIPSPDPYRRSAPLDLFPAQIINKVVVAKTFTPDQQGSYTGGGINIVTKSFPEKAFANFGIGASYNPQVSLKDNFLTYDGGKFDWAGMDDGTRALPDDLARQRFITVQPPPINAPAPTTPANIATRQRNIAAADDLDSLSRSLGPAKFGPHEESSLLNHNFNISAGDTTHFLGLPLGVFGSLSYRRDFSSYDDGQVGRYSTDTSSGLPDPEKAYSDAKSTETVNWSGMVTLAYQLHPSHELGFTFLYNQNSEKSAQLQAGTIFDDPDPTYYRSRLTWTERNLQTYQLKGSHQLPEAANIRVDWLAALSATTQLEPDVRFFNYLQQGGNYQFNTASVEEPRSPTRYYRELSEDNRNEKIDITIPFRNWNLDDGEFKLGLFDSFSQRTFYDHGVEYNTTEPWDGNLNTFLNSGNLGYLAVTQANQRIDYTWPRYISTVRDSYYEGESGVQAAYLMVDTPILEKLRLVGGVRVESTDLRVHSESDIASSWTGLTTNDSKIVQTDVLPAAGLIWSMKPDMNLRAHFSKTIARPSFRELAAYRSYDPILDDLLDGNPFLDMSAIDNYDLRWEWFFRPGEIVSVSLFYKSLKNAIERKYLDVTGSLITFDNRKEGTVYGIEFEARKNLGFLDPNLSVFSVGGNVSLINSETELTDAEFSAKQGILPDTKRTRQLYDQSPYIVNLDLTFDNPSSGTTASIIFNTAGPRITIASLNTEDIFEQPAPGLDVIIGQKLGRHLGIKFTARNLLNPKIERTYGEDSDLIYSSYKKGMSFGLSMSYDF